MILRGKPDEDTRPRVWLEISKAILRSNLENIRRHVAPAGVMAVLKADAYGLGVEPIAQILREGGVACYGVAEVSNAVAIKPLGLPIHILGALLDEEIHTVVREGFVAPITDLRIADLLSREAVHLGRRALCQFKIDTGMGRLGIQYPDALEVMIKAAKLPGLEIIGLYSHFPHAYADREFSLRQVSLVKELVAAARERGIALNLVHIANSDGIHNMPESFQPPFNMVRTGINIYGAYDCEGKRAVKVEPVLELKTRLISVRELPAGASIGYGRTAILDKPARIGTVSAGYADGVPFGISGRGGFSIGGRFCPVIGRVSMDFTTVDLACAPEAKVGDDVVCLGGDITVFDWARYANSITYDVICSFGPRVQRCYV